MKRTFTIPLIALFGIFASFLLLGCASKNIQTEASELRSEDGKAAHLSTGKNTKAKPSKEDSIIASNPLKNDPDNTGPNNPLIEQFGDIPQVRTYIRLRRKYSSGTALTIDEAIKLYTVKVYLYPTPAAKEMLKDLKADKKRYERLGIPADVPVLTDTPPKENLPPPDFVLVNPFTDDPDNPSPHNPFIKKFGDIPEVRTYIRLQKKFRYGIGLNVDEAIELYTAEAHLYPSLEAKARLKSWIKDKERYERLGILTDEPVMQMQYNAKSDTGAEVFEVNEASD